MLHIITIIIELIILVVFTKGSIDLFKEMMRDLKRYKEQEYLEEENGI